MSDTLNKDDINNNLDGDGNEKPFENSDLSEQNELIPAETNHEEPVFQETEQPSEEISEISGDPIEEEKEETKDEPKSEIENIESEEESKSEIENEEPEDPKTEETIETAAFDSKYQINLIDERLLRVRTTTNQSVTIDCNVIVKEETQSNRIYIHPKAEELKQEVEVLVKIGSEEFTSETENDSEAEKLKTEIKKKESNYQISLVNENVLRIKISTNKSISVDSSLLDKTNLEDGEETQSNKIFIHPRQGIAKQDVEVFIKIGEDAQKSEVKEVKPSVQPVQFKTPGLTPNPLVVDILSRLTKSAPEIPEESLNGLTDEEKLDLKIGRKNPWKKNKEFLRMNLQRGFIAANIITIFAAIMFYSFGSNSLKEGEEVVQRRLIVMQDLPENLNQLAQNIDDPNKPPEEKKTDGETGSDIIPPKITPKRITPPRLNLPKIEKTLSENDSALNKELDSLRKFNDITENKSGTVDTTKINTSLMPDSLLRNLSENEVGLIGRFPPNWKQIDARDLNQTSLFTGVILVDTTVKKEETITMNIEMDVKGDRFNQFQFTKVFHEDTLSKTTIYVIEPKTEGKLTYYRFYVAANSDNIFVNTFTIVSSFDKYKNEIERVVKSIRVKRPEPKVDN